MAQAQGSSRPKLLQATIDAFSLPDLRGKLLFTIAMLVIFRFVAQVPVPGVEAGGLRDIFERKAMLGMIDLFSGGEV